MRPWPVRIYVGLLRLLPEKFRERHGAEMVRVFQDMWKEKGGLPRTRIWVAAAWDLVQQAGRERRKVRLARRLSLKASRVPEDRRGAGGTASLDSFVLDLVFAFRQLRKRPGFTLVLVVTLALGVGAATAVFSVVEGVLLRPLPYPSPDRLTVVWTQFPGQNLMKFPASWPEYQDYRQASGSYSDLGLWGTTQRTLTGDGDPVRLNVAFFTWTMFDVLGVEPELGRVFTAREDRDGRDGVVVLSHGLWERRFGSDPSVVGGTVEMDGTPLQVLGVMPQGFAFPDASTQAWIPVGIDPANPPGRASHFGRILGRLAPGVTLGQARTELRGLTRRWQDDPSLSHTWHLEFHPVVLRPLHQEMVGDVRTALLVLLGAVGIVLLIACANVANLLLVRGEGRLREMSIRAAVGAGRGRIVRQLVTESLVTALLGGVGGVVLAYLGLRGLLALAPPGLPRADSIGLNPVVMGFALGVTVFCGVLFGLAPALQTLRADVHGTLRDEGRGGTTGRHRLRVRHLLAVSQTALAVVLLVAAGLLLQSFSRLRSVDPGFRSDDILAFSLSLPTSAYPEAEDVSGFHQELMARLEGLPGVQAAGLVFTPPLTGSLPPNDIEIEGRPWTESDGPPRTADLQAVSAKYFSILKIPVLQGRVFDGTDRRDSEPVAVVDEIMARSFFDHPSEAVGDRVRVPGGEWARIVGIVGSVRQDALSAEPRAQVYLLSAQTDRTWALRREMTVLMRTGVEPLTLVAAARGQVGSLDPDLPVYRVTTMARTVDQSTARQRFTMFLQIVFAAVALILAVVGVYGVLSFSVAQRTREMSIRMALGAERTRIVGLIVRQGMALVGAALGLGILGALSVGSILASLLYEVSPRDPLTLVAVILTLGLAAFLACWIPARRASAVDPQSALRLD